MWWEDITLPCHHCGLSQSSMHGMCEHVRVADWKWCSCEGTDWNCMNAVDANNWNKTFICCSGALLSARNILESGDDSQSTKEASKQGGGATGRYPPCDLWPWHNHDSREQCDMNLDLEITKAAKVFHGPGKLLCHEEAEVYELDRPCPVRSITFP